MTSSTKVDLHGYRAASNKAAFYEHEQAGYLRVHGEDRQDFLQRQSTNDVTMLAPERAVTTVLTSATARILDVLTLIHEPEAIGVVTLPGRAQATARFLQSKIFFNDQASVEVASDEVAQFDLIGPQAPTMMKSIGLGRPPSGEELLSGEVSGAPVKVFRKDRLGYRLLIPAQDKERLINLLQEAGASSLSPQDYAVLRVEMGLPEVGHELTEDYTPLETGLDWTISGEKGCYTGQEVIARQITYDKVTRQIAGLRLAAEVKPGDRISALEGQRSVGEITSYVHSPRLGHIALGVLRKPHHEPGTEVVIAANDEAGVNATVASLPFE